MKLARLKLTEVIENKEHKMNTSQTTVLLKDPGNYIKQLGSLVSPRNTGFYT